MNRFIETIDLTDGWTLEAVRGPVPEAVAAALPVPATVPGSVHTDLLAAGLVPEPFEDANERLLGWVGLCDWRWSTTVAAVPAGERVELLALGLDTVAQVEVDGVQVLSSRNMHRTHRVDLTGRIRPGSTLTVTVASPIRHADAASLALGARPHTNHHPYNAIRKMACSFGWDWGPDLASSGIWRPLRLQGWSSARLGAVRPLGTVDAGDRGRVELHVEVERDDPGRPLTLTAEIAGRPHRVDVAPGEAAVRLDLDAGTVRRWWPRGHGEQPLYELVVELADPDGTVLERRAHRIGFRSVATESVRDQDGTSFTLVVNDRPVFVKGLNWIPDDVFPHRVDGSRLDAILDQAEACGANLLRVWGGGVFESDEFYDRCDERGIMVWQDFLFACAAYAEEEPLRSEVEAEVRDNVTRLLPHPALVLWNGNNENLWGHEDWGWQPRLDGRTWGAGYYHDLLPRLVAELDPHRPYTPGSPFTPEGSGSATGHPNDPEHGTVHVWDVWNARDWSVYRDYRPRFVAEWGWQAPPTWTTLTTSVHDDPLTPASPGMQVHQKAASGDAKLTGGLVPHLPVPDDVEDWHWAMQLNQAWAVRAGVEHFRSGWPRCTGSIYWQLNDCWPVTSWAVVDGEGRRKPAFFALRRAHADRLVVLDPRAGKPTVTLVNDTDADWSGPLRITRRGFDGTVLATQEETVQVPARGSQVLGLGVELLTATDPGAELLVAEVGKGDGSVRGTAFLAEDRDCALAEPELTTTATPTDQGVRLEVRAANLVKDLALLVDRVDPDAEVQDSVLTLLPGESVTLEIHTERPLAAAALGDPAVLRSANQLVRRR